MTPIYAGLAIFWNFFLISVFGKVVMGASWGETFKSMKMAAIIGAIVSFIVLIGG
jgi:hypothetical protein